MRAGNLHGWKAAHPSILPPTPNPSGGGDFLRTVNYFLKHAVFQGLLLCVGIAYPAGDLLPAASLCCLTDGQPVSDGMWKPVETQQLERLAAYTQHFPPTLLDDGVKLLTGFGGRDAALERLWKDARPFLLSLLLSNEPNAAKEERLKEFERKYKTQFSNKERFDALCQFLKSLALDDNLIWNQWDPDDDEHIGIYEANSKYYHQQQQQERTLFHGVTVINTSLENLLRAFKNFPEHRAEKLEREILDVYVVGDSLYRGQDQRGNPVEIFQVQYTQDVEKVGRRTYRLSYCLHWVTDEATQRYYLRSDAQQVSLAQAAPQELERVKKLYGEQAGVEFVLIYGLYLFLPLDGVEPDTAYCLVHYTDVNPRKGGENTWIARGTKQKVVRTNLADLKMRALR